MYIGIYATFAKKVAIPIIYPGIDIEETPGIILNVFLQLALVFIFAVHFPAFDAMVTVVFVNMSMVSQFLIEKINAVQGQLREEKLDARNTREKMLSIVSSHIKYNR